MIIKDEGPGDTVGAFLFPFIKTWLYLVAGSQNLTLFMLQAIRTPGLMLLLLCILSFHKHPAVPGPDCTRLYKVYMWRSAQPNRNIDIFEYYYDTLNRVTGIKQYLLDSIDGSLQYKFIKTMTCFYKGAEQLPYKTKGFHYLADKEIFYFYDSSGKMIKDSMSSAGQNDYSAVHEYRWCGDTVITDLRSPSAVKKTLSVLNNNNIVSHTILKHVASHIGLTHGILTYDNKVNPMNKLNISPVLTMSWPFLNADQRTSGYNKNNITEWILGSLNYNNAFIPKHKWTFTYQYNNAGLPVECRIDGISFSSTKDRIQYHYVD